MNRSITPEIFPRIMQGGTQRESMFPSISSPVRESFISSTGGGAPTQSGGADLRLLQGYEDKYSPTRSRVAEVFKVEWRGFSGFLQFFTRFPLPIDNNAAKLFNQIFWNIIFFILIYGAIYGALIKNKSKALSIPEEMDKQTESPWTKGFYFAIVTMTTLGFGDITPGNVGGQMLVMSHIVLFFLFNFIWTLDFEYESTI